MVQHSFGFEFKLANSWQHERETCPQRDRIVDGAGMSVAQVSVLCWREADRHQTPLLSLMCARHLKQQTEETSALPPEPSETLYNMVGK